MIISGRENGLSPIGFHVTGDFVMFLCFHVASRHSTECHRVCQRTFDRRRFGRRILVYFEESQTSKGRSIDIAGAGIFFVVFSFKY